MSNKRLWKKLEELTGETCNSMLIICPVEALAAVQQNGNALQYVKI
jgi:hypothetical protein